MAELDREVRLASGILKEAGQLLAEYAIKREVGSLEQENKPDGSLVTKADQALNDFIVERLHEAFPDDAICAEEGSEFDNWRARRRWVIDPIDGTYSFAHGRDGHSIMLGLAIKGAPALGAVFDPMMNTAAVGALGVGVQMNAVAWSQPSITIAYVSGARRTSYAEEMSRALGFETFVEQESVGSRAMTLLRGEACLLSTRPNVPKLWDTLAPAALILAAGGQVTDHDGKPLRYDVAETVHARGMVASLGANHEHYLALVREWHGDDYS